MGKRTTSNGPAAKTVETLTHSGERRSNIPTAEFQSVMREAEIAARFNAMIESVAAARR